jgi:hypothetical protein
MVIIACTNEYADALALLALSGNWLLWYLLLSASLIRYLFPPAFIAALFLSA